MSILSGYKKVKDRVLTSSGYKLISRWTSSNTVEFDDGSTAQTKHGAINGITSDVTGEAEDIAASIKVVNELNNSLNSIPYFNLVNTPMDVTAGQTVSATISLGTTVNVNKYSVSVVPLTVSPDLFKFSVQKNTNSVTIYCHSNWTGRICVDLVFFNFDK